MFRSLRPLEPVAKARPPKDKLDALGERFSRVVEADMTRGIRSFRDGVNYSQMAQAVYSGDYKKAMRTVPWDSLKAHIRGGLKGVAGVLGGASKASATELVDQGSVPQARARSLSLGTDNPKVDEYLSVRTGELITNITDATQVQVQDAVRRAKETGGTPRDIAAEIKPIIGLNDRQAGAVVNYRQQLAADGTSRDQIDKLSDAYSDRLLQQRAMMIGRTEASYARNYAQMEVWNDAQDKGYIPENSLKVWVTDADPCPVCEDLDGTEVRLDEQFDASDGQRVDGPPLHPNCFCLLSLSTGADE